MLRKLLVICLLLLAAFGWAQDNTITSSGTGFVVDARGYVLTNEHVIHGAQSLKVIYQKNETFTATVISVDPQRDLALLKINTDKQFASLPSGNSTKVRRQQSILVIGFPFGEDDVTSNSGKVTSIRTEGAEQVLVTDAVVNPGNSGGPMLNDRGEVVGVIKSLLIANIGGSPMKAGENYAIPVSFTLPMLAAIPDFDFTGIGKATQPIELAELDESASRAVVQVIADGVNTQAPSDADQTAFHENALKLLTDYLDRMEYKYEVDESNDYPLLELTFKMDNSELTLRIVIDAEREIVYVFLSRYAMAPVDNPQLNDVMKYLMELNWKLNVGKMEWDSSDGEIRMSFTFTTENGVGYEAFAAILDTLLRTGDQYWPELDAIIAGRSIEGEPEVGGENMFEQDNGGDEVVPDAGGAMNDGEAVDLDNNNNEDAGGLDEDDFWFEDEPGEG